jgi:hypothetical protein
MKCATNSNWWNTSRGVTVPEEFMLASTQEHPRNHPLELLRNAYSEGLLRFVCQSGPFVNITTLPTKCSTCFCPFGVMFDSHSEAVRLYFQSVLSALPFTAIVATNPRKSSQNKINPTDFALDHRHWHGSNVHTGLFRLNQKLSQTEKNNG